LGQSLLKPLLRYLLPNNKSNEIESSAEGSRRASFDDLGIEANAEKKKQSRSNHQRLLAIEIFNALVRASQKNTDLLKVLGNNLELITSVSITVLQTSDSWQQKKVKKTMLTLNIFTKLSKNLLMSKDISKAKYQ